MSQPTDPRRPMTGLAATILFLVAALMGFAVAKKTGILPAELSRRGAAIMIGLVLVVAGNFVPKLRLFQTEGRSTAGLDRFAGWIFVLCGLAFSAIWLFAPIGAAKIGSPLIGAAGFILVLARWLVWTRHGQASLGLLQTPGRLAVAMLLVSIFWTFAIFFADAVWGDAVAQWMAVGFIIALGGAGPFLVLAMRRA